MTSVITLIDSTKLLKKNGILKYYPNISFHSVPEPGPEHNYLKTTPGRPAMERPGLL